MTEIAASALPPMAVAARAERLADRLGGAQLDSLLVTHLPNVRYLTGFTGSASQLLLTPSGLTFVTDGRYAEQAALELAASGVDAAIETGRTDSEARAHLVAASAGAGRLGVEAEHVSWALERELAETWSGGVELVPTRGLVEGLRQVTCSVPVSLCVAESSDTSIE